MPVAAGAGAGWAAVGKFIATVVEVILVNYAVGAITKALAPKPSKGDEPSINVTIRSSVDHRKVVFGRVRASGTFVYYNTSGENNKYLHYVVAYAGHQVQAVKDIWVDNIHILNTDINDATGDVETGDLSGISVWRYMGTSTQAADPDLVESFPGTWTSAFQLKGICYVHVKMPRSDSAFPNGAPGSVTALVEGALLYDPREDDTNGGSGDQRADDPSTWTYPNPTDGNAANPALIARWILTGGSVINDDTTRVVKYGLKESDSRVNDPYLIAAANICDELLTGAYTTPQGDQYRYACHIELSCAQKVREWLEQVLACMAGTVVYVNGKWRIYAGDYDAPVHALGDADVFGDLEIQDTSPHSDRYNAVAAVFRAASADYFEQTTQFRTDSTYETQDGDERITKEVDLTGVTNDSAAQRLCEIEKRKSRLMRVIKIHGALNLLKVSLWETFTFSSTKYGWTDIVFRCIERQFDFGKEAGAVELTARIEASAVWADMLTADYQNQNTHVAISNSELPEAPTELTVNGQLNGILLNWAKSETAGVTYEVEESTSSTMSSPTVVYAGADNQASLFKSATTVYYYRVRALRAGQYSTYQPSSGGVSGAATAVATVLSASADPTSATSSGSSSSQTTNSITVTPTGGTPGYTYAWTWLSGGSGISIGSASAATTSFSSTGLSSSETRTGTARCTVTDSAAGTKTIDVSVSIARTAAFTVVASPATLSKDSAPGGTLTTASTTATPSGGTPSYTYSWAFTSDGAGITINSASAATTTFTAASLAAEERRQGTAVCTVTDSLSNVVASNSVNVVFRPLS